MAKDCHTFLQTNQSSVDDVSCPHVIRTGDRAGQTCMKPRTQHRCFSRLDDAWRVEFGDEADRPRWVELLRSGVDIFALDYDAILPAMYALSVSAEGDCYLSFSLFLSRQYHSHSTLCTFLVRLADPSSGRVLARSSTVLLCLAVPSGSLSGLHLPSFSTNLVSASGPVAPPCTCRLLSLQTLLWHHRLGHPSLPRLRGMHSCLLVSGLPRSLPPLPPLPAPPCLPCVEGRQRAAPHSSFPSTTAPLRTLHMDIKGEVLDVLIPWIRAVRLQLRERFDTDLPVLRLHSDRGAQPLAPCLLSGDLTYTALDGGGWRCVGVLGLGVLCLCPRYFRGQALHLRHSDVTFNKSVPFYRLFPYHTAPLPPPPLFLAPGPPLVDPLPPLGPALLGEFQVDPVEPVEVGVNSGAAGGGVTRGRAFGGSELVVAGPGGIEIACTEPGVAESEGAELGGAEPERAEPGGAEPKGTEPGGTLSTRGPPVGGTIGGTAGGTGAAGAGGATGVGAGGTGARATGGTGARVARGTGAAGPLGARTGGTGAAGAGGAAGVGAGDLGAGDTGAGGAGPGGAGAVGAGSGDTRRLRPYFVPLLQQVLGLLSSTGHTPLLCPPPEQSQPPLQPASPLPAPSPYTEQIGGLTERREPISRPPSPVRAVRTGHRVPRLRPPLVPYTHHMALRPSSVAQSVPLPPPPASSLVDGLDPESDLVRAASPTVTRLLATVVTDPSFQSAAASALIAELVEFAAACRLDYAASLNLTENFEWQTAMDAEMASWKSRGTSVDAVPHPWVKIVDGMWIFRVKRPPGSPPAFKARYIARGFSQQQGVDFFQTFSLTLKMTTLRHSFLAGQRARGDLAACPPGFTGSFPAGTQWSLRQPVYDLCQAPREWHDKLRMTLAALGLAPSTAPPWHFLRTDTSLPPFYVLVYVDDLVFATADTEALALVKSELQKRQTCTDLGELSFSASASGTPRHSPLLCLPVTCSQLHLWTSL
ncbi:unnamed protein product [Closterium sp. NIES-53]